MRTQSVNECLLKLHKTGEENGDPNLTDFIEGFLEEQIEGQKMVCSEFVVCFFGYQTTCNCFIIMRSWRT
jgi:hypothetical protein